MSQDVELRWDWTRRAGFLVQALILAAISVVPAMLFAQQAAVPGTSVLFTPLIVVFGLYFSLVILVHAVNPGPAATVSTRGLWLLETGWIPWRDMDRIELVGSDVHIFVKSGREPQRPWFFRPHRMLLQRFVPYAATIGARGLGVDAERWMRYAKDVHGVPLEMGAGSATEETD